MNLWLVCWKKHNKIDCKNIKRNLKMKVGINRLESRKRIELKKKNTQPHMCVVSRVWLFLTPWTVAHQIPLSMGFPRQEYWNESPFSSPGYPPDPEFEPTCPVSPSLAGGFFTTEQLEWLLKNKI